ncbi:MAG: hypothetical protein ACTSUB_08685 [Candidatus Thorarchaeota archaeon]
MALNRLNGKYLSLLIALQEKPFASIAELVERLEESPSKPTIMKRLRYLEGHERELLPKDGSKLKAYFTVNPILNMHNMGYEPFDIILETNDLKSVERIEQITIKHPYTTYRIRCFGAVTGMFLQFRIPIGTRPLLDELVESLVEKNIVEKYTILPQGNQPTIYSTMRIDGWNPDSMSWKFDWDEWFGIKPIKTPKVANTTEPGSSLEWLTKNDLYILQQVMTNARRSNIDMIEAIKSKGLEFTPQTFGRRLKMIQNECIVDYRVSVDPSAFDIVTNVLVTGKGKRNYLQGIYDRMKEAPIPFRSTMKVSGEDLFWYVRMPTSHLSSLLNRLHSEMKQFKVYLMDYENSLLYYIWPETLDEEKHEWRKDREFMVDQVLK